MLFIRKSFDNIKYENIIKAFECGEYSFLMDIYEIFALPLSELAKTNLVALAGEAIKNYMHEKDVTEIVRLGERVRETTSIEWRLDWNRVKISALKRLFKSERDYFYVLLLGTFHPNGYFRERCINILAEYPDTLSFIMLRCNDWVSDIRDRAYTLAVQKMKICSISEVLQSAQILEKLKKSRRIKSEYTESVEKAFRERIKADMYKVSVNEIHRYDYHTRKNLYNLLISGGLLDYSQLKSLLSLEKNTFCKRIIIRGVFNDENCPKEAADIFIKDKSAVVRRCALEYKFSMVGGYWNGLENLLLDKYNCVSELAEFIVCRYTDISLVDFYSEHLKDENPISAVRGIGRYGKMENAELIMPFLESNSNGIVCETICSLGRLLGTKGEDIYFKFLQNKEPSISKAAYKAIRYSDSFYGAECEYRLCIENPYIHVKRYALELLLTEGSWIRLPYLLDLYEREEFELFRSKIYLGMLKRDMYGKINAEKAEVIINALEKSKVREELKRAILFDMKFVVENR